MEFINLLGISIDNITRKELLDMWGEYKFLIPVNVDVLMKLRRDTVFRKVIEDRRKEIRMVVDSQVIRFSTKWILNKVIHERISGSDFLPFLCDESKKDQRARVFLLGGMGDAAQRAQFRINERLGKEIIVGALSPSLGFDNKNDENTYIINCIRESGANVLAVGVGALKQEKWIFSHADKLPGIQLFIAVGATIDFEAGKVSRAPAWVSNSGLEWLYRLFHEPRRLAKRYIVDDLPFFWLLFKQRIGR